LPALGGATVTLPVSGPGALSRRSDQPIRQVTGLPYGDAGALAAQQAAAPMAATPATPTVPVTPLHAPTERPGQPVTAGAAAGAGPGPEVLTPTAVGMPAAGGAISQALARVAASDNSGLFAQLYSVAQSKGL
jgi:hypothetical protein